MTPTEKLQREIADHRASVSARRARAFIDCPDYVLGMPVRPVTPATWTMLQAVGSRLLTAATPLEGDIRNYLWFHSRLYMPTAWWTVPTFAKWGALFRFNTVLHQRSDVDWYAAVIATAANEIRGILSDAIADAPTGGRSCAPGPCLEAQLIHFCGSTYHWPAALTQRTPLRRLFQLVRSALPANEDDEAERNIRFAHLRARNAELAAQRAASGFAPPTTSPLP